MTVIIQDFLMLDTFICGAHTTCAEALYAELPVLTKIGNAMPARVAASFLKAADMEDCITYSPEEYIERAVEIASNPDVLAGLKKHLKDNKNKLPLFDQKRWVKDFEDIIEELVNAE